MIICPACETYLKHIKVLEGLLESKRREYDHLMNKTTGKPSKESRYGYDRPDHLRLASSQ